MTALFANPALPGLLRNIANPSSQALGALGEQLCYHMLTARGYVVSNVHPGEKRGDLRVITTAGEVLRVEVKTARQGRDGRYQFMLHKGTKCSIAHADIVVLLCVIPVGFVVPFVVPAAVIRHRAAVAIRKDPWTYGGALARYRQSLRTLNLEVE